MADQKVNLTQHFKSQKYDIKEIMNEFKKNIIDNVFFINKERLIRNSIKTPFDNTKWNRRPDIFCLDIYNEPYLWPVILLVNDIRSYFDFKPENFVNNEIITPKYDDIIALMHDAMFS